MQMLTFELASVDHVPLVQDLKLSEVALERPDLVLGFEDQGRFRLGREAIRLGRGREGANRQQRGIGVVCEERKRRLSANSPEGPRPAGSREREGPTRRLTIGNKPFHGFRTSLYLERGPQLLL